MQALPLHSRPQRFRSRREAQAKFTSRSASTRHAREGEAQY